MTNPPRLSPGQTILIADTGPLIGFMLGKKIGLLYKVCKANGFVLQIPKHVDIEVVRVLRRLDKSANKESQISWLSMKRSGAVVVIDEPTLDSPEALLIATYVDLLHKGNPLSDKDLGEYYVISHAVELTLKGLPVIVAIDDGRARELARARKLAILSTEQLLDHAIHLDLFEAQFDLEVCYREIATWSKIRPLEETLLRSHQAKREALR